MHEIYIGIISLINLCLPVKMSPGNSSGGPVFRVFNGTVAKLGEFPYQVAMRINVPRTKKYLAYCGGAILSEQKVLTAAHCAVTNKVTSFEKLCCTRYKEREGVYAVAATLQSLAQGPPISGSADGTEQWRKVIGISIPKDYDFPHNDIAVVSTEEPFVFNDKVGPLPLARKHMDYGRISCVVAGFGKLKKGVRTEVLMWANLDLLPDKECTSLHDRDMKKFICTLTEVTDVLAGDSGGALVCMNTTDPEDKDGKGVIVGVACGGRLDISGSYFTRVTSYNHFIDNKAVTAELQSVSIVFFTGFLRWLHGHG